MRKWKAATINYQTHDEDLRDPEPVTCVIQLLKESQKNTGLKWNTPEARFVYNIPFLSYRTKQALIFF